MEEKLLYLLEQNSRYTTAELATMLAVDESQVICTIDKLEKENVIIKYKTLINWEKTQKEIVNALIELRVTPQRGQGFDAIASQILEYPQVTSMYLMSGGYDLMVILEGKTMKEVALFVSETLAPMESIVSTATHFILKKYKDAGAVFSEKPKDNRQVITL